MKIKAQFISSDVFFENSVADFNIDTARVNSIIMKAQSRYIQEVLGSTLYERLMEGVWHYSPDNTAPNISKQLNNDEIKLITDYIQPCLIEYTAYLLVTPLANKMVNKGVTNQYDAWSTSAGLKSTQNLKSEFLDMAQFYLRRLKNYIEDNVKLFPEYGEHKQNLQPKIQTYTSGVYMRNKNKRCK